MTSADVAYSLDRAAAPKLGGYYSSRLDRIASVTATGPTKSLAMITRTLPACPTEDREELGR